MRNEYWVSVAGQRFLIRAPTVREAAEFQCAKVNAYPPGTIMEVQPRLEPESATVRYIVAQDAQSQERYVTLEDSKRDASP